MTGLTAGRILFSGNISSQSQEVVLFGIHLLMSLNVVQITLIFILTAASTARSFELDYEYKDFQGKIFFVIPTFAEWRVAQNRSFTTHLINAQIRQDNLEVSPKLSVSNFLKNNHHSVHISNCTYLYYTQNENGAEGQGSCGYIAFESLHKILYNNYIEVLMDQSCIIKKIDASNTNLLDVRGDTDTRGEHYEDRHSLKENITNELLNDYIRDELRTFTTLLQLIQKIKMFQEVALEKTDFVAIDTQLKTLRSYFGEINEHEKKSFSTNNISVYLVQVQSADLNVIYNSTIPEIQNGSILLAIPWTRCLLTLKLSDELDEEYDQNEVLIITIFHQFVDPIVHSIIFTIGVVWNGVLILIFARQRHLWSPPNIMLFNLALVDLFALFFSVLAFCFTKTFQPFLDNNESVCRYFVTVRPLTIALSCLSVVALSILRYVATGKRFALHSRQDLCNLTTRTRFILYIMLVWSLSLALSFPYPLMVTFSNGRCFKYGNSKISKAVTLFEFLFYCVLLPFIMIAFNTMTVRRLRESTQELNSSLKQNGVDVIRHRTANMLMAYIIAFLVTYVPHYFLRVLRPYGLVENWETTYRCMYKVSYYMVFANYIFNPMLLYIVSGTFRVLFNNHFSTAYKLILSLMTRCNEKCRATA